MDQTTIRRRLQGLRESRSVNQVELAEILGFNDRQTLSDIELGKRNVAPDELVRAAEYFGVDSGYFTDPFELAGEARFSWRKSSQANDLDSFEQRAGGWIATYRHLSRLKGESVNSFLARVDIHAKSSLIEAANEGEAVSRTLGLGDVPATNLATVLETKLDTLILHVDAADGISGAACQLGSLNTIIINRRESPGRRAFDMGHELFHLLTWQEMEPPHIEGGTGTSQRYRHIERLADNFSAGLLMPRQAIESLMAKSPLPKNGEATWAAWIKDAASKLCVSGPAMKWRLVSLGLLKKAAAERIEDASLRLETRAGSHSLPPQFSRCFVENLGWGIEQGHLSVRRAARVMGTTVDDLSALFTEHGLKTPYDL
ncbi:XRE family transcriptional regulator [Pinirhizobacter sp.]|jgi:Zn-dependent peptidase ImmA (M78 family)/DNA-binding XRE family transcriptional regulator|uniref:helix-turn-helix domain-containing protein n=1 Tax=Pinirhizobacter sp. TaxID=2950432 RepID=UPI002F40245E